MFVGNLNVYGYLNLCREFVEAVFPFALEGAVMTFAYYPENTMCIRLAHFDANSIAALLHNDQRSGNWKWGLQAMIALSADIQISFATADGTMKLQGACGDYELDISENNGEADVVVLQAVVDTAIFEGLEISYAQLNTHLQRLAYLNPAVKIITEDKTPEAFQRNIFHYPDGVIQQLRDYVAQGEPFYFDEVPAFSFTGEIDGCEIRVACQVYNEERSMIRSFANNIETREGGTFLNSILDGMALAAKQQAWSEFHVLRLGRQSLAKKLILFAAIRGEHMNYQGATRSKLGMPELQKPVKHLICAAFASYLAANAKVLHSLISTFSLRTDDE